eukprot:NODE_127_length_17034_cov_0.369590.p18 type:complete len:109 gc:universal NODE_127_length_17034_cov_0.369590:4428-4102(-)
MLQILKRCLLTIYDYHSHCNCNNHGWIHILLDFQNPRNSKPHIPICHFNSFFVNCQVIFNNLNRVHMISKFSLIFSPVYFLFDCDFTIFFIGQHIYHFILSKPRLYGV